MKGEFVLLQTPELLSFSCVCLGRTKTLLVIDIFLLFILFYFYLFITE